MRAIFTVDTKKPYIDMKRILFILFVTCSMRLMSQPVWTEQAAMFSVGFGVGWTFGERVKPAKLALSMAVGKTAYDLAARRRPEPAALAIGTWMAAELRLDIKGRKRQKK